MLRGNGQRALAPRVGLIDQGSWDTANKGMFFYLYLFVDIYGRKIVGWQVYEYESGKWAAEILRDVAQREGIDRDQVKLH